MLRIAFAASEFAPLVKTGGLADVAAGLTRFLATVEADLRIFLPAYDTLADHGQTRHDVEAVRDVPIRMGDRELRFSLRSMPVPGCHHAILLVDCPELFHRGHLYSWDADEHVRWGFFCRAVLESCQRMGFAPDIVHAHDWHTALLPVYLKTIYAWDGLFANTRSLLTIHNLAYQGEFDRGILHDLGLESAWPKLHRERLDAGRVGLLESGILNADWVSTVSESYSHEIRTPAGGMGLDAVLRARGHRVVGIVNGVDLAAWSPEHDPHIAAGYSVADPSGKAACRRALLEEMELEPDPEGPVFGLIARLTWQKGVDLVLEASEAMLAGTDARLVVLGAGDPDLETGLFALQDHHRGRVRFWCGYNEGLAHRIEAGSDLFLMPSRFEPCGLNQMYSQRYGTPPIVHRTGGLSDTVEHHVPGSDRGTGFAFDHADADGLIWAVGEAMRAWADPEGWASLVRRCMEQDWSWHRQGRHYLLLYDRMMQEPR
jgi:starch synthase